MSPLDALCTKRRVRVITVTWSPLLSAAWSERSEPPCSLWTMPWSSSQESVTAKPHAALWKQNLSSLWHQSTWEWSGVGGREKKMEKNKINKKTESKRQEESQAPFLVAIHYTSPLLLASIVTVKFIRVKIITKWNWSQTIFYSSAWSAQVFNSRDSCNWCYQRNMLRILALMNK